MIRDAAETFLMVFAYVGGVGAGLVVLFGGLMLVARIGAEKAEEKPTHKSNPVKWELKDE